MADIFAAIDFLKEVAEPTLRRFLRTHRGASYAEMRFESMFSRTAAANDGEPRDSNESEAAAFGLTIHYSPAGGVSGHGQSGLEIGRLALTHNKLLAALNGGLNDALDRAKANAREKARVMKSLGANR